MPIIPIIALSNNNVGLNIEENEYPKIVRSDMLSSCIYNYLNDYSDIISSTEAIMISDIIRMNSASPKKYKTLCYFENIRAILKELKDLFQYWMEDAEKAEQQRKEYEKQSQLAKEKEERYDGLMGFLYVGACMLLNMLDP